MTRFRRLRWVGVGAVAVVMAVCAVGAAAVSAGGRAGHRSASSGCYPRGLHHDRPGQGGTVLPLLRAPMVRLCVQAGHAPETRDQTGHTPHRWRSTIRPEREGVRPLCGVLLPRPDRVPRSARPPPSSVTVIDMVTGRRTFYDQIIRPYDIGRLGLVLKPNGSVAWIESASSHTATTFPWEVYRHDSTGTAVVDQSRSQIVPSSLATGGQRLYWTDAGSPRSAPFH